MRRNEAIPKSRFFSSYKPFHWNRLPHVNMQLTRFGRNAAPKVIIANERIRESTIASIVIRHTHACLFKLRLLQ